MSMDAYHHELDRKRNAPSRMRGKQLPPAPSLFDAVYDEPKAAHQPITPGVIEAKKTRVEEVLDNHATTSRYWIDRGKPIAMRVANRDGQVTAETFRHEAIREASALPTKEGLRVLSWIPAMFAELVRERKLRKRTRSDGSIVRIYSKAQGNEQTVYEVMT